MGQLPRALTPASAPAANSGGRSVLSIRLAAALALCLGGSGAFAAQPEAPSEGAAFVLLTAEQWVQIVRLVEAQAREIERLEAQGARKACV